MPQAIHNRHYCTKFMRFIFVIQMDVRRRSKRHFVAVPFHFGSVCAFLCACRCPCIQFQVKWNFAILSRIVSDLGLCSLFCHHWTHVGHRTSQNLHEKWFAAIWPLLGILLLFLLVDFRHVSHICMYFAAVFGGKLQRSQNFAISWAVEDLAHCNRRDIVCCLAINDANHL